MGKQYTFNTIPLTPPGASRKSIYTWRTGAHDQTTAWERLRAAIQMSNDYPVKGECASPLGGGLGVPLSHIPLEDWRMVEECSITWMDAKPPAHMVKRAYKVAITTYEMVVASSKEEAIRMVREQIGTEKVFKVVED